jgi:sugar lactone lactonase YvrE
VETLQTTFVAEGLKFGEGPRWHDGKLWLSDIQAGRVAVLGDDGELETVVETRGASGLGWLPDGRLVISTLGRPHIRCLDGDEVTTLYDLKDFGWSLNDMVVTPDGRIYADLYLEAVSHPPGGIVLVTPDGEARVVATDMATPNGLAVTPDQSTLIASETGTGRVHAFTIGPDGDLTDQRTFADLGPARGPDGLCLDEEGAVWVASYKTGEVLRVLDGGEVTHRVEVAGRLPVAPALGGADGRTLFVVVNESADLQGSEGARGEIEMARVEVAGVGCP